MLGSDWQGQEILIKTLADELALTVDNFAQPLTLAPEVLDLLNLA